MKPAQTNHAKQLDALNDYYKDMTALKFGKNQSIEVDQLYLQMFKNGFNLFSYPPALNMIDEWIRIVDGYD